MVGNLIALLCVVCLVDGQAQTFAPGAPLPEMPDDEAQRLLGLGAARVSEAEPKPKGRRKATAAGSDPPAAGGEPPPGDGVADGEGDPAPAGP